MFKNENITKYYRDEHERKLLDRSYNVLISGDKYSIARKLTAVEYLYRFIEVKEHRERLQILHDRELNSRVRKHLKAALDGTLFDFLKQRFDGIETFDQEIEKEYEKDITAAKQKATQEMQSSIAYIRYAAKQ